MTGPWTSLPGCFVCGDSEVCSIVSLLGGAATTRACGRLPVAITRSAPWRRAGSEHEGWAGMCASVLRWAARVCARPPGWGREPQLAMVESGFLQLTIASARYSDLNAHKRPYMKHAGCTSPRSVGMQAET